jgi:hypothetical protein
MNNKTKAQVLRLLIDSQTTRTDLYELWEWVKIDNGKDFAITLPKLIELLERATK